MLSRETREIIQRASFVFFGDIIIKDRAGPRLDTIGQIMRIQEMRAAMSGQYDAEWLRIIRDSPLSFWDTMRHPDPDRSAITST